MDPADQTEIVEAITQHSWTVKNALEAHGTDIVIAAKEIAAALTQAAETIAEAIRDAKTE